MSAQTHYDRTLQSRTLPTLESPATIKDTAINWRESLFVVPPSSRAVKSFIRRQLVDEQLPARKRRYCAS